MLKTNELRVNNIIENGFRKMNGFQNNYEKVTMLNDFGEINVFSCPIDRDYSGTGCQMPLGVIITEEWLLNSGFHKTDESIFSKDLFKIEQHIQDYSVFINDVCIKNDLEFIHQLQNLYFALTGVELELSSNVA